jgi:hypothetical protein
MREHPWYDDLDDEAIHVDNDVWARAVDDGGAAVKYWSWDDGTSGSSWWIVCCELHKDNSDYVEMMLALASHEDTPSWWLVEVIPLLLEYQPGPFDDLEIDIMTKMRLAARCADAKAGMFAWD